MFSRVLFLQILFFFIIFQKNVYLIFIAAFQNLLSKNGDQIIMSKSGTSESLSYSIYKQPKCSTVIANLHSKQKKQLITGKQEKFGLSSRNTSLTNKQQTKCIIFLIFHSLFGASSDCSQYSHYDLSITHLYEHRNCKSNFTVRFSIQQILINYSPISQVSQISKHVSKLYLVCLFQASSHLQFYQQDDHSKFQHDLKAQQLIAQHRQSSHQFINWSEWCNIQILCSFKHWGLFWFQE